MKKLVIIFWALAIIIAAEAVIGIKFARFTTSTGWHFIYYNTWERIIVGSISLATVVVAIGCQTRKIYAWWTVNIAFAIIITLWIVELGNRFERAQLPPQGFLLAVAGEMIKIGASGWFFFRFWVKRKSSFSNCGTLPLR